LILFLAIIIVLTLLTLGLPIAYAFFLAAIFIIVTQGLPLDVVSLVPFYMIDSFPLMAVPFFILAGMLMEESQITEKIFAIFNAIVGRMRGGLGSIAVLSCMFFGALTGSSAATVSAIGTIMIPEMVRANYPLPYATALVCASGYLGMLIPPSIAAILYGISAHVSIARMFLATIVPAIMIGGLYIFVNYMAFGRKEPKTKEPFSIRAFSFNVIRTTRKGFFAILMPVIILGGIYSGFFTPTEAAAVAVFYGLIAGGLIYRTLGVRNLINAFRRSAAMSAVPLIIVALAGGVMGRVITLLQVPVLVAEFVNNLTDSPIAVLMIINVFLLILGMFLETATTIVVVTPVLAPLAGEYGIDPIHLGAVILLNIEIGLITPPFATNLFIGSRISNLTIDQFLRPLMPFLLVALPVLVLVTYIPQLTLWLPNLVMGK
jgi:C4-dicarboxylate transporter DctM subunit